MRVQLILTVFLSLALNTASAQSGPWFGLDLPVSGGDPHEPVVDVSLSPAPALVPSGEAGFTHLQGDRILADVGTIVGFSRQSRASGDRVWGRVTGFPAARQTIEWVADELRQAGLGAVQVQEYAGTGSMWWPTQWEVRILGNEQFGAGSRDVVLESALPTGGSEIAGGQLTAELRYAGSIEEPVRDLDYEGKIAVQRLVPKTGAYSERRPTTERARELMNRGAVAVINVVEQIGNMHVRDFSNCNGPCFNLGTADGEFLQALIEQAEAAGTLDSLKVQLSLQAETLSGLKGHNAVGVVPGRSQKNIIVNAHADGWFDAAGDNADGLAVLLAMARHFASADTPPARTLVFVASGGHHSTGLNGPAAFVAANPELTKDTVLVLNLEHLAQFQILSGSWEVRPTEQPMSYSITNAAPFLTGVTRKGMERYGFNLNPEFRTEAPGDLGGYRSLGIPMIQAIHSGPMYHVSGDVLATISEPGLERAARFFSYLVGEVAEADTALIDP